MADDYQVVTILNLNCKTFNHWIKQNDSHYFALNSKTPVERWHKQTIVSYLAFLRIIPMKHLLCYMKLVSFRYSINFYFFYILRLSDVILNNLITLITNTCNTLIHPQTENIIYFLFQVIYLFRFLMNEIRMVYFNHTPQLRIICHLYKLVNFSVIK